MSPPIEELYAMHAVFVFVLTCLAFIAFPWSASAEDGAAPEAELEALAAEAHEAVLEAAGEGQERAAPMQEAPSAMSDMTEMSADAAPPPGMTRVSFDLSRRRKPYSVHLLGTELTCRAPCFLDVPNGEAEFVFSAGRRDRVQLVRKYDLDGDNLHLELVRRNNTAMRIAGITFAAIGGGALGLGIFGTVLAIESRHSSNEGVIGYAVFIVIGYVGALAYGIPGILMIAKSRPKVVAREAPQRLSVKETIKESFRFGVVPLSDGAAAMAGFRF